MVKLMVDGNGGVYHVADGMPVVMDPVAEPLVPE